MIRTNLRITKHAYDRMRERKIKFRHVRSVLRYGKVIEDYPGDEPYPSSLILGWIKGRPMHVVVADNMVDNVSSIITIYEPDRHLWEPDFEARRKL